MECNFKYPDGSQCCNSDIFKITKENNIEYILSVFLDKIDDKINHLCQMNVKNWQDGYKAGYQDGKDGF